MFEDMFGNMEEKQAALKEKLAQMTVEIEVGDGAVRVEANCNRQITDIKLDLTKMNLEEDQEQLEDLLMVGINRVLERAAAKESAETENLLKEMLPPGLGDMGNLFG